MKPIGSISLSLVNNKVGPNFKDLQQSALLNNQQTSRGSSQLSSIIPTVPIISRIPIQSSTRKVRDSGSLFFMFAFLGFLAYIIWDGMLVKETDVNLIVHGHDSYGNICGRNNKPIRFVEKSGQNFTDKPYTKYTLINAQFERYTLDTDRSFKKNGELYYIREQIHKDPLDSNEQQYSFGLSSPSEKITTFSNNNKIVNQKLNNDRILFKRSASNNILFDQLPEAIRKNQTLLNSIKSSLMYQYPALYGYSPTPTTTTGPPKERGKLVTNSMNNSNLSKNQIEFLLDDNANKRTTKPHKASSAAHHLEVAESQTEHSLLFGGASMSHSLSTTRATPSSIRPTTITVLFNDNTNSSNIASGYSSTLQTNNNNDIYEHVLIAPKTTNPMRSRSPDILNQFEVNNQLLYLTECVDYCPSDHVELIFYRCMPKNWRFSLFPNAINVTRTFIDDILTDMSHCYRELIYIFSFALVLSLALLILLRFLASIIIWSCLLLLITLFLSMASYSWTNYYYQILELNNLMPHDSVYAEKLTSSDKWLIGSIFLTFVSFATIATVIFMRKRILLVTMLFKESGKAISDMPLLLLQPVLTFAALVLITTLWTIGLICLQSIKIPMIDRNTGFVVFKAETLYKVMKWYHIFAFLWVSHFAIACQHYVIGASVSKWYFSTDRYNLNSPIGSSVSELILYYMGSVALGSFLVAIFKVIRIVTRQIQYLVQRNCMSPPNGHTGAGGSARSASLSNDLIPAIGNSNSTCGSFAYVWRLFIWFFDNIVMIINRDAYVEIAIHGHSFLSGAKRAFKVLSANPLRLLAIKSVSNILLIIAKICVVFGTVSMAMLLLDEKTNQLNYSWSPIVISAMYAYIVAHWFLSVYEMVIDALFICYCEDYEQNKSHNINNQITGSNFMAHILNNDNNNSNNNNNAIMNS